MGDSSTSFSALCSAVPQVPASSHSASRLGWRPLPNASLGRRLCRNCRLGSACLAELDDARISILMSRSSPAHLSSQSGVSSTSCICNYDCPNDYRRHQICPIDILANLSLSVLSSASFAGKQLQRPMRPSLRPPFSLTKRIRQR